MTDTSEPLMVSPIDGLTEAQTRELLKPLDPVYVYFDRDGLRRLRVQYIRMRLTQIFGFAGWGEEIVSNELTEQYKDPKSGLLVLVYRAHIRLHIHPPNGRSTFFDGIGIFEGTQRELKRGNVESVTQAKHTVSNGASSAALCRAALALGDQFGGSLHLDEPPLHGFIKGTVAYPFIEPEPLIDYYGDKTTVPAQATSPAEEEHADTPADEPDAEDITEEPEYTDEPDEPYHDRLGPKETVIGS